MIAAGNIGCMTQIGARHGGAGRAHRRAARLGDRRAEAAGARGLSGVLARLVVLLCLLAGAGAAEERRLLDAEEAAPFRGVGRLNVAGTALLHRDADHARR